MPSLKYRVALTEPLAPQDYGLYKLCKYIALGQTIEMPIDLLDQLAALFCPYTFSLLRADKAQLPVRLRLPPLHRRGIY